MLIDISGEGLAMLNACGAEYDYIGDQEDIDLAVRILREARDRPDIMPWQARSIDTVTDALESGLNEDDGE